MDKEKNISINQQNHPHQEGAQNNITPQQEGSGQNSTVNNSMGMSDMMNVSEEQRAGREHEQQDKVNLKEKENEVQQNERQP